MAPRGGGGVSALTAWPKRTTPAPAPGRTSRGITAAGRFVYAFTLMCRTDLKERHIYVVTHQLGWS
jgi:hypothetical protein